MRQLTAYADKIQEIANNIVTTSDELNVLINDYFDLLGSINREDIWNGTSANAYFRYVIPQQTELLNAVSIADSYGKAYQNLGNSLSIANKKYRK